MCLFYCLSLLFLLQVKLFVTNATNIVMPIDFKTKTPIFDSKLVSQVIRLFTIPFIMDTIWEINSIKYKNPILYMENSNQNDQHK